MPAPADASSVHREGRETCYGHRDAFYACIDKLRPGWTKEEEVPAACRELREAFLSHCRPAWVKHFDLQRDAEARMARVQQKQIQHLQRTGKLAGVLAGANQQVNDR